MPGRRTRVALLAATVALLAGPIACGPAAEPLRPAELWFYYLTNFGDRGAVEALEPVWRRAAAAGYTHVLLADHKFARLGEMNDTYFERLTRAKALAAELGLEIVPAVFQVGRAGGMLAPAPDLAEAIPVRDVPFEVRGGEAHVVQDPATGLDATPAKVDRQVSVTDGVATIGPHRGRARFMVPARVHPFRCYRVSVEVRTDDYHGTPMAHVLAGDHAISYERSSGIERTQDWTRYALEFNSLDHDRLDVWFGDWERGARGTIQWRDWRLEELGPLNVVRRAGAPLVIRAADGAPAIVEGRDVGPVVDTLLGNHPWRGQFDDAHEPPRIPSTLADGTRFGMSWHMAGVVRGNQVACCLSDSGTMALLADEAARMRAFWNTPGYMMMHDEIRTMNWDDACRTRGLSAGALLADHARACTRLLEGAQVYVWGDMFDPFQNAVRDYYLVNGDLEGAWEGLDRDVVIVNWNGEHMRSSLRFFAGRGHRQILAGYYDGRPDDIVPWLREASQVDGVIGAMYTTWKQDFDDLEAFARACGRAAPAP